MKRIFLLMALLGFFCLQAEAQVGIGTTAPGAMLDIRGLHNGYAKILEPTNSSLPGDDYDMFYFLSKNNGEYDYDAEFYMNTEEGIHLDFGPTQLQIGQPVQLLNTGASFSLTPSFGIFNGCKVGIGTTNPQFDLEIRSDDEDNFRLTAPNGKAVIEIAGGTESEINFHNDIGHLASLSGLTDALGQGFKIHFPGYFRIHGSAAYEYLFMRQGNVGIGTTSPSTTLHLFNESIPPVLQLEAGNTTPGQESGVLKFVFWEGGDPQGAAIRMTGGGNLEVVHLTDGTLAINDYPRSNINPTNVYINQNSSSPGMQGFETLTVNGSFAAKIRTIAVSTDLYFLDDYTILGNAVSNNITLTLPNAFPHQGRIFNFKKSDASVNTVTVDARNAELIDGSGTYVLTTQWQFVTIQSDGANWYVIGKN